MGPARPRRVGLHDSVPGGLRLVELRSLQPVRGRTGLFSRVFRHGRARHLPFDSPRSSARGNVRHASAGLGWPRPSLHRGPCRPFRRAGPPAAGGFTLSDCREGSGRRGPDLPTRVPIADCRASIDGDAGTALGCYRHRRVSSRLRRSGSTAGRRLPIRPYTTQRRQRLARRGRWSPLHAGDCRASVDGDAGTALGCYRHRYRAVSSRLRRSG